MVPCGQARYAAHSTYCPPRRQAFERASADQIVEDRAFGPPIATPAAGELPKCSLQLLQHGDAPMQSRRSSPRSCCVLTAPRLSCTLQNDVPRPNDLTDQWRGHGFLTGESVAPALRACAGRAAAIWRGLYSPVGLDLRGTDPGTCDAVLAAKCVQRPGQSNSRLPESDHAMLKINIPQHSQAG